VRDRTDQAVVLLLNFVKAEEQKVKSIQNTMFIRVGAMAVAILIGGATSLVLSLPATATEQYAKQTGQACAACHQNPQGGGPLTPAGDKFKAAQQKPPKTAH
jgi:mono/diheme cytochrome c family protein